jgi:hypothetical protein
MKIGDYKYGLTNIDIKIKHKILVMKKVEIIFCYQSRLNFTSEIFYGINIIFSIWQKNKLMQKLWLKLSQ